MMRSSVLKMLYNEVPLDRKIEKYQEPFTKDCTPYNGADFTEATYKYCEKNSLISNAINICKVIVIGDSSVGKTCIINRRENGRFSVGEMGGWKVLKKIFDSNYKSTIGVDFEVERFDILNIPFNLQIWDTAGQERFKCIAQSYYRGAHAILVVFDLSDMFSLQHAKSWLTEALDSCTNTTPNVFLVGTKRDLLRKYAYKHIEQFSIKMARNLNAEYWSVSAKTGLNINNLFNRVAVLTFEGFVRREINNSHISKYIGSDLISIKQNKTIKKERKCDGVKCARN